MKFVEFNYGDEKITIDVEKIYHVTKNRDGNARLFCMNGCCYTLSESYETVKNTLIGTGDENGD